jgi:hypothetical protein
VGDAFPFFHQLYHTDFFCISHGRDVETGLDRGYAGMASAPSYDFPAHRGGSGSSRGNCRRHSVRRLTLFGPTIERVWETVQATRMRLNLQCTGSNSCGLLSYWHHRWMKYWCEGQRCPQKVWSRPCRLPRGRRAVRVRLRKHIESFRFRKCFERDKASHERQMKASLRRQ